ncbi:hypothetical protein PbB2_01276 [Candidatus Phycosocius bacilliformis]|uniref:YdhG-like domain-containing protein n=1 Tax=Candidatus Phycosocius bacilliformis TaxID=1445552 RepID=A0A2P2E975_9PROT|nr:DUF1801 domain-containing protein [Candidatus Phycosocius bacilliformis]GBF57608.1 hypothetical protein PbB2_01276 [Candidatus Phycosocius bacilliformis]
MAEKLLDLTPYPAVLAFVDGISPVARQDEAKQLVAMFARASGQAPHMYGSAIIGFGTYHYRYDSGREGEAPRVAFSPRKAKLVLYLHLERTGADQLLAKLGKHSTGKGCLYINKLSDIDLAVLEDIVALSFQTMAQAYPM